MKKRVFFTVLLAVILILSGCSGGGKEDETEKYYLAGHTYYNTVDAFGNADHSQIWFGKDGSFVMRDNFAEGYYELTGTWSIKENVCTLDVETSGVGNYKMVKFEIVDDDTLILKTTLAGSRADSYFTTSQIKGDPFVYGTYYNFSQPSGDLSYVEINSDASFSFVDRNELGVREYKGKYTMNDGMLTLTYYEEGTAKTIQMLIQDRETLVLQNDVGVSATGDIFSITEPVPPTVTIPCEKLTVKEKSQKVEASSGSFNLGVKASPADTTDEIIYRSNDEKIVTVDGSGNATAGSKVGKTTIEVTCGSQKLTISFETTTPKATGVKLDQNVIKMSMNETRKLKATVVPSTADQSVKFKSSDSKVAKVDKNGNITGVLPGKAKITVTASDGASSYCNVYVEGETVIFEMEDNVSVKAASGQKIPYKAYLIICQEDYYDKQDVTLEVEFHTAYTSALDIDGNGNVYAKGAIYDTVDIPVYFTWNDGSSLNVTSQTFTVHVEK